jgi:hypothetical protein
MGLVRAVYDVIAFASTLDWGAPKILAVVVTLAGTGAITGVVYAYAGLPSP